MKNTTTTNASADRRAYNESLRGQARQNFLHTINMMSAAEREREIAAYDAAGHDHEIPFLIDEETGKPAGYTAIQQEKADKARPTAYWHITRLSVHGSVRTRMCATDVYGHETSHCDPAGCAGDEIHICTAKYDGGIKVHHVYELREDGTVIGELTED